jgi:hypothetical protein
MSKTIEKYYVLYNEINESISQENYVLLNSDLPYTANSQCGQVVMYTMNLSEDLSKDLSKDLSEDLSKDLSKDLSEDLSKDLSKDLSVYTQPNNILSGILYSKNIIQENTNTKIVNVTGESTMSFDNGMLVFSYSRDFIPPYVGYMMTTKPTFKSGIYDGKDICINLTVLQGNNDLIIEYKIIYYS